MKELVAQEYLDNAKQSAAVMYRDCPAQDRLAFHVGMLEGYIIQMVNVINSHAAVSETQDKMIANYQEQIANLQDEILFLNRDLIKKDN